MTISPARRPDRRRAQTRRRFFEALTALIMERGYDSITIQDIANRADLGRATFYLHFNDKEHLLISGLREVYDAIVAELPPITLEDLMPEGRPPSFPAFQQAQAYRPLYRAIQQSASAPAINARVRDYLAGYIREEMNKFQTEALALTLPFDFLVEHMASSLMGLLLWWLADDESPYSAEEMARMYHRLNAPAWLHVFGMHK